MNLMNEPSAMSLKIQPKKEMDRKKKEKTEPLAVVQGV